MTNRSNQLREYIALSSWRLCVSSLLFITSILLNGCHSNQHYAFDNEKAVMGAVLAEDWAKVGDLTKSVTADTPSAELRLIRGHALFALDKNNESSCLFLSVTTGDSSSVAENLKKWENWTQKLAANYPNKAVANYLKGDALARLERWDEATLAFNKALEINPNHALSLNARGLVYAVREQWDPALVDLTKAISLNQGHAAFYANLGAFWMMKQVGAKGAEAAFDRALEISPDFVFALHGRACVRLVFGKLSEARKDLEDASAKADCLGEFLHTSIALTLTRIQNDEEAILAQVKSENPSMEVVRRFDAMTKNGNTGFMGTDWRTVTSIYQQYPQLRSMIEIKESEAIRDNPKLASAISRTGNAIRNESNVFEAFSKTLQSAKFKTGGVQIDFPKLGKDIANHAIQRRELTDRIAPAAGFKTSLEEAAWDEGNWPFEAINGLFYTRSSKEKVPRK